MTHLLPILCALTLTANAATRPYVTLVWDPSPDTNVAGYNVYYGTAPRTYTEMVSAGRNTWCVVTNLTWGLFYYFAATAYDSWGLESDYSPELRWSTATDPVWAASWFARYPIVETFDTDGNGPFEAAFDINGPWFPDVPPVRLTNTWMLETPRRFWRNATHTTTRY